MAAKTILTSFQRTVLDEVADNPILVKQFYLTGGTALAEFHLRHRLSEDLDFFSEEEFNPTFIQGFIKKLTAKLKLTNIEYRVQMGLHIFLLRKNKELLKIDFNYYPFPRIDKKLFYKNLALDSMRDIAINKLQTIATKPRTRDFIDLYCIIQKTGWTINDLRLQARSKFDWYVDSVELGSKMILVREREDYPHMLIPFDFKECEAFWLQEAKSLEKDILKCQGN
ncbi:nucleotidyl transferase AbiEii/AbiGii toxin family protein [Patescibacteria group bacterium]|nr:nucleotidyl transferase AbiEii/AbiGii toxin family protein [Patescibacteria group bacterium]MCL5010298.1 nucleotidyl transferase AbiEii/AbiGii toxin family protein [Patescibacteria group bacterium]